jgi:hypothetical protein
LNEVNKLLDIADSFKTNPVVKQYLRILVNERTIQDLTDMYSKDRGMLQGLHAVLVGIVRWM